MRVASQRVGGPDECGSSLKGENTHDNAPAVHVFFWSLTRSFTAKVKTKTYYNEDIALTPYL